MTHPFSIIVPVHNEAVALRRSVPVLMQSLQPGTLLIFVCNGCTDDSQSIIETLARAHPHIDARIVETREKGKPHAIRMGEEIAGSVFPRFFVDADIIAEGRVFSVLCDELSKPSVELVSPASVLDTDDASFAARSIAETWDRLPFKANASFRAVIGVSSQGRKHWGELPDVIADDTFMALQVPANRKKIIASVSVIERPPRTFWSCVGVRARWLMGDWELRKFGLWPGVSNQRRAILAQMVHPSSLLPTTIYVLHRLLATALAKWRQATSPKQWYRDETSRRS